MKTFTVLLGRFSPQVTLKVLPLCQNFLKFWLKHKWSAGFKIAADCWRQPALWPLLTAIFHPRNRKKWHPIKSLDRQNQRPRNVAVNVSYQKVMQPWNTHTHAKSEMDDVLQGSILAVVRSSKTTIKSCGRVSKITNSSGGRVSFKEPNLFLQFLTSQCTRVLNVHQPFSDSVL